MIASAALWLGAGLVVAGTELLLPGFFLIWIGLAAIGVGLLDAVFAIGWHLQLLAFAVLAAGLVGLAALRMRRRPPPADTVNAPAAGLVGATCQAIAFDGIEGRVGIRDSTWPARLADRSTPVAGEHLRVVGLDGNTLLVTRP